MGKSGNADISLPCLMPKTIKTTVEKKTHQNNGGKCFCTYFSFCRKSDQFYLCVVFMLLELD